MKKFTTVLMLASISACTPFMAATTKGPIKENYGERTFGSTIEDSTIESKTKINIKRANPRLEDAHIVVKSYNQVLLIIGQVPTQQDKAIVTSVAENIRHVKRVHNELEVGPNTSFMTRTNDELLVAKIKARFIGTNDVVAGRIEVLVENGVVFLMGLVTQDEANRAVSATKKASGIKKIVKVFEYIP